MSSLLESIVHLLLLLPFVVWGLRKNHDTDKKPLLYFAIVYIAINAVLHATSNILLVDGQHWNWSGKIAALLAGIFFVYALPNLTPAQAALNTRMQWHDARPIVLLCAVYFIFRIAMYVGSGEATLALHAETLLFQATLPGIQEELLYRGILMGLLSAVFAYPRFTFLRVDFGLAAVITSLLFGLAHGVSITQEFGITVNYFSLFRTCFDGLLFALLTEKTKSVIPAILYHNLLNLIGSH
ncbi:MAG TPA: CPBP family intramembrane metalloprotease [Candidatus Hydrogenedentes bacterium]|nr:CPBP family intramembrane metalloprotease [Candidatus Hydrogenedentota bacterium]HRK35007.1 CPBP family intramembrane metalloprotease [Candidatus Hydrogenedentota bacterium]